MKILNLDKLVTRRDKVIVLGDVEHVMVAPTVKDFIYQARQAEEITRLQSEELTPDSAEKVMKITIATLHSSFPTISLEQLENLTMEQLNAIREYVEEKTAEDAATGDEAGEATGKVD